MIGGPPGGRVDCCSRGDEPHRMFIEPLDERVLLMEDVGILTGELVRCCLIRCDGCGPNDGWYSQIDVRSRPTLWRVRLRGSSARAQQTDREPQHRLKLQAKNSTSTGTQLDHKNLGSQFALPCSGPE